MSLVDCLVDNLVSGLQRFFCHAIMNDAMLHKRGLEIKCSENQTQKGQGPGDSVSLEAAAVAPKPMHGVG